MGQLLLPLFAWWALAGAHQALIYLVHASAASAQSDDRGAVDDRADAVDAPPRKRSLWGPSKMSMCDC